MTTTTTQPTTETALDPFGTLTTLIVALLAPMFIGVCGGDIGLARRAASEAVSAYRAQNHADLIAAAQIVGFGLAVLGSLSASMAGDVSVSMALRLRGNANACNRSAEQNRRALTRHQATTPLPARQQPVTESEIPPWLAEETPPPEPDVFLNTAAEQLLAAESQARLEQTTTGPSVPPPAQATARAPAGQRHQDLWAIAMVEAASKITVGLPNLPPAERKAATMRATMLSSTALDLTNGASVPPFNAGAFPSLARPNAPGKQPPPA
jgi:hypothetical protein